MGFVAWLALALAVSALFFCAYLWLDSQRKVYREDIRSLLQQSSEELSKDYARQFRAIESEWDDQYQKFSRLAGRMDRSKVGLPKETEPPPPPEPAAPPSRSELLRRWRNK